jgi:serine/threonine protein phosphatase 1
MEFEGCGIVKTYAIGDLHGSFGLLCEALSISEKNAGEDGGTFVVCGDFIDRGPNSRGIIELLMEGPSLANWRWVVLKGNHEDMAVQCIDRKQLNWWVGNGGGATLRSYHYDQRLIIAYSEGKYEVEFMPKNHIEWLRELPLHYIDKHRAFVHAGFDPNKALKNQDDHYMMWVCDPLGTDYSFEGRHVVHGHQPYENGPILTANKSNIDTFAWLHGRLAIAVFDDEKSGGPVDILWAVK